MARRHHLAYIAAGATLALAVTCPMPAFAATVDDLKANYLAATDMYDSAKEEQQRNAEDIKTVKGEIKEAEAELAHTKENLSGAVVAMYKHQHERTDLLSLILESESITDAMVRYDNYQRIEKQWEQTVAGVKETRAKLDAKKAKLEEDKKLLAEKVEASKRAIAAAEAALADADHSDGALYHQVQGNNANCGATAFIVGVNILLHGNYYTDNVEVWKGPGFQGDSTQSMDAKGTAWLAANGLGDKLTCEAVPGDINTTEELQSQLEQGRVVVISSGSGSYWKRANGKGSKGLFPDGHWIVFYHYADGVFYANDSSVGASKGAGCAYSTSEMQSWLDGRSNHFATVLSKNQLGEEFEVDVVESEESSNALTTTTWQTI